MLGNYHILKSSEVMENVDELPLTNFLLQSPDTEQWTVITHKG